MITDFASDDAAASGLVIQPDGKLIAAGRSSVAGSTTFSLARYASDGTLDPIFGTGGRVVTAIGNDAEASALVLQPADGRLVAAGAAGGDFALARYHGDFSTLAVTRAGTGSGAVTSAPAGVDCGGTCSALFAYGTVVNLTATPVPGSVFSGWSGDPDCTDGTVTMNDDKTCTATFDVLVALTVTRAGPGSGTVTSDPAGIDCGATCTSTYPLDTVVKLTATPAPGARFAGWSGDPDCTEGRVTLDRDKTCTANFASDLATLSVMKFGAGSGTVTSNPPGIDCGATCSAAYDRGTMVTLTAAPAPGSIFGGWSGNCTANGTVTLATDASCTAIFGLGGADLTGSWIALKQVCRGPSGGPPCRLKGRFAVRNAGVSRAGASVLRFALSSDGATPLTTVKQVAMPAMAAGRSQRVRLRAPVPGGSASGMFVLGIVDADGTVVESNEENNVIAFGPLP